MAISAAASIASAVRSRKSGGGGGGKKGGGGGSDALAQPTPFLLGSIEGMKGFDAANAAEREKYVTPARDAGIAGGLFPAIQDSFNPNPNTTEIQAITGQAKQLRNQAMNEGVRGGQLRSKLLDINKWAGDQRLDLMEKARQQAAQRGYNILQQLYPSNSTETANKQLSTQGWLAHLDAETKRLIGAAPGQDANQAGKGGAMGGLLGQGLGRGLGGLNGKKQTPAVGNTPFTGQATGAEASYF